MSSQPPNRPLGAFLKALAAEKIDCILIGMMAAIEQGAPLMTIDYDFWVNLPERQYVRLLAVVKKQGGSVLAPTLYELRDGTQVNAVFKPTGLRSFASEYGRCRKSRLQGQPIRILPLPRIIANKRAANREKDRLALPVLERTLRLARRVRSIRVKK
jgi:hypothetical protein